MGLGRSLNYHSRRDARKLSDLILHIGVPAVAGPFRLKAVLQLIDRRADMTAQPGKLEVFANPFFVVLLGTSVLFVLTVLGYWVSMSILEPGPGQRPPEAGSLAVAQWLDRNAPWALAVEFLVMLASGITAMATDRWFSPRAGRRKA
jgi:hypothetical protein